MNTWNFVQPRRQSDIVLSILAVAILLPAGGIGIQISLESVLTGLTIRMIIIGWAVILLFLLVRFIRKNASVPHKIEINEAGFVVENRKDGRTRFYKWNDIKKLKEGRHTVKEYLWVWMNDGHSIFIEEFISNTEKLASYLAFRDKFCSIYNSKSKL